MLEEIGFDFSYFMDLSCSDYGDLRIYKGLWDDMVCFSLVWSGWGKVSVVWVVICLFVSDVSIDLLVFIGVVGVVDLVFC